jgi:toxin ParE1/3/4
MRYQLVVQEKAVVDIQAAFIWYEEARVGLGLAVIQEIERCLNKISNTPENYSYINKKYRRIKTNRFPYLIIFQVFENKVVVFRVQHARRKRKRI